MLDRSFLDALEQIVGNDHLLTSEADRRSYECDGLTGYAVVPQAVVLARSADEVRSVVKLCSDSAVAFVARGAGTGLSGGAVSDANGIVISLQKLRKIISIDVENARMVVEPGVTNSAISAAAAPHGLYYAPDPSSQVVCSIGGNVAENSGGAHCLKYGFTTHHVLALEMVTPQGALVEVGSDCLDSPGPDLRGLVVGSEGTLGIVTSVTVRLLRRPESVATLLADFDSIESAGEAVTRLVGAGVVPAAVEMLDQLAIEACEASSHAGYSLTAGAILLVEVDGQGDECAWDFAVVQRICRESGALAVRVADSEAERALMWKGRKSAFAAMGLISPNFIVQDSVVPRTRLTEALVSIKELSVRAGLRVANVFHAGDGNLHPLVLYNEDLHQAERAEELSREIVEACVALGGSITGEHGVGLDKACLMPLMFSDADLDAMKLVRGAFDPAGLCNPGKIFPTPRLCGESSGPYKAHPLELSGTAQRF